MLLVRNIKLLPGYSEKNLEQKINKKIYGYGYKSYKIQRESLDSRKHDDIHYELSVYVDSENEELILKKATKSNNKNITLTKMPSYSFPHIMNTEIREFLDIADEFRPVIIGSGPAGYHAAVKLAKAGFKPIVLERGNAVEERVDDIEDFWNGTAELKEDSNVCFGEGGAGTFSDGKLNTGNKDKGGYFHEVLETFVSYGADESILYKAKPHIGTDVLRAVVKNMRLDIERLGGEVRFGAKLIDINYETSIETFGYESELPVYQLIIEGPDGKYYHKTHSVILAIGHSARDTYEMLLKRSFTMEQKSFAMGVRVEHPAEMINESMYGKDYKKLYGDKLPVADYKLVYHTDSQEDSSSKDGKSRSVFSFCMCPGGYVVNSSTEPGTICINGMSYSGRNGMNSNAAIVVNIEPEDYSDNPDDILAGVRFQRSLEANAFEVGKGVIPVQMLKDYKTGKVSSELGSIKPEIKGRYELGNLKNVFPKFMADAIEESFDYFGKRIEGYDRDDTVLSAVEARTSSPVRILRNTEMMCDNFPGIIPAGEGAGYAGGITSAAADGIKSAEAVSEYLVEDMVECYKGYEMSKYM